MATALLGERLDGSGKGVAVERKSVASSAEIGQKNRAVGNLRKLRLSQFDRELLIIGCVVGGADDVAVHQAH
jgi:hypothetical protein